MQEKYTKIILDFLNSHSLISVKGIEETLNIPQSTIGQATNGRLIPEKHIYPLICFLADYGLKIDGYDLIYDAVDDTLTGRKWIENLETIEIEENGASQFEYIIKEDRILITDYFDLI